MPADLAANPSAHMRAAFMVLGASRALKKTIFVLRGTRGISYAVLMPSISGILMCCRTISGFSCRTFATASWQHRASPRIWKECHPRKERIVFRVTELWSAINILAGILPFG
jgi:hypothetical protein